MNATIHLYDHQGNRLYLTSQERDAFLYTASLQERPVRTFCSLLYYTGCRISEALQRELERPLWPWSRSTAWRRIISVMKDAGIVEGPHRVPKGLRHGYAIHALNRGVQLNLVSKWMGHAKLETTAIYANAVGEEQQAITARMWS